MHENLFYRQRFLVLVLLSLSFFLEIFIFQIDPIDKFIYISVFSLSDSQTEVNSYN